MQVGGNEALLVIKSNKNAIMWGTIGVIATNPTAVLKLLDNLQHFYYLLFFDIDYPLMIEKTFLEFGDFDNQIFAYDNSRSTVFGKVEFNNLGAPESFLKNNMGSLFLINTLSNLTTLGLVVFVYLLIKLLQYLVRNADSESKVKQIIILVVDKF